MNVSLATILLCMVTKNLFKDSQTPKSLVESNCYVTNKQ